MLKIKRGDIAICKALVPPRYLARYQLLHGYNSNRIESSKQTIHQIDALVESVDERAEHNKGAMMNGIEQTQRVIKNFEVDLEKHEAKKRSLRMLGRTTI